MASRKTSNVAVILASMFAVWWTLLVFAVVSGLELAWMLVKWSPIVLVPWGLIDVIRATRKL